MLRAHKIRLNPTLEQEQYLRKACGTARFCFNWGLAEWERQYREGGGPSAYALKKQFNAIKRQEFPWVYDVSKCAADTGFRNLDAAFKSFFRRCKSDTVEKGYPRFKSRKCKKQSYRIDGRRVRLVGHWIKIPRLDTQINMAEVLRPDGKIKSVTISRCVDCWYAAINIELEPPEHEHSQESVGIDLGIKTLAMLSDRVRFENQRPLQSELRKLKRLNQELSRRQKGSGRWKRTREKLARLHRCIANRRLDHQHKTTTWIARKYQVVGIEDLNVAGMLKNHRLALSIADASFGEIKRQLSYKTEWYGGELIKVDRFFLSSKLCRYCGCVNSELTLSDREWTCDCGAVHDRDLNAARNIETEALRIVADVGSQRHKTRVERMSDSLEQFSTKRENTVEERQPSRL